MHVMKLHLLKKLKSIVRISIRYHVVTFDINTACLYLCSANVPLFCF